MLGVPDHLDSTHHRGHNSTRSSTCATCNRLQIFNKLEVGRLDSTLSLFVIISSYIQTLSVATKFINKIHVPSLVFPCPCSGTHFVLHV